VRERRALAQLQAFHQAMYPKCLAPGAAQLLRWRVAVNGSESRVEGGRWLPCFWRQQQGERGGWDRLRAAGRPGRGPRQRMPNAAALLAVLSRGFVHAVARLQHRAGLCTTYGR
jgi:hypothetical protein